MPIRLSLTAMPIRLSLTARAIRLSLTARAMCTTLTARAMRKAKNYFGNFLIHTPTPSKNIGFHFQTANAKRYSTPILRISDIQKLLSLSLNQIKT